VRLPPSRDWGRKTNLNLTILDFRLDISENEPETLMQQDADINSRRCLLGVSLEKYLTPAPN